MAGVARSRHCRDAKRGISRTYFTKIRMAPRIIFASEHREKIEGIVS